jgi:hypothetical protein
MIGKAMSPKEANREMNDVAMRRRMVVLVIAALLSVAGTSMLSATIADDVQALRVNDGDAQDG